MKGPALEILDAVERAVGAYRAARFDVSQLPEVRASLLEGRSVLLEWAGPEIRLGFTLEPDPAKSGWYLVTSQSLGGVASDGPLHEAHVQALASVAAGYLVRTS